MTDRLLVTDTHPIIYYFCGRDKRLGKKALAAFNEATTSAKTSIFVPTPVVWELAILVEEGAIKLDKPFPQWIDTLFQYPAINPVAFDVDIAKTCFDVRFHADPFDRAIVATAIQMDLPLISNDRKMHLHLPCKLFWD